MTGEARALGYFVVFISLQLTLLVVSISGFDVGDPFYYDYVVAFAALHLFNFVFNGFGIGDVIIQAVEARRFRKQLNKEPI